MLPISRKHLKGPKKVNPLSTSIRRIPVTIVTGFLGAGKTTLLSHLLKDNRGKRIAVIENEYAKIDIDSELIRSRTADTVELHNGCICCSKIGELEESLLSFIGRRNEIDNLVIETTGVANPGSIMALLLSNSFLRAIFHLDAVITVVDAKNFLRHVMESEDYPGQIACADVVLINKTDLIGDDLNKVVVGIQGVNCSAKYYFSVNCEVSPDVIFRQRAYDNENVRLENLPSPRASDLPTLVKSHSIEIRSELDFPKFQDWIVSFIDKNSQYLYRFKGIVWFTGKSDSHVLQGIHEVYSVTLGSPNVTDRGVSRLVFIGKDLDPAEISDGLSGCIGGMLSFSEVTGTTGFGLRPQAVPTSKDFRVSLL